MVAPQNIGNKEVICKIFQDKELRDDMASAGVFWLTGGAGAIGEKHLRMIVRRAGKILCKDQRSGVAQSKNLLSSPYILLTFDSEMCYHRF
jgi:hypothetical protein